MPLGSGSRRLLVAPSAVHTRSGVIGSSAHPDAAGRGGDRVGDGAGRAHHGRLADALGAERALGRGHLDDQRVDRRDEPAVGSA